MTRTQECSILKGIFIFAGKETQEKPLSEVLLELDAFASALESIAQISYLKKYLNPGQAEQALRLVAEAKPVLEARDEVRARPLLQRMHKLIDEMPVPTWDLFLARFAAGHPQTSPVDRSQAEQIIIQMERAASRADYDTANQHLEQLRQKRVDMFEKLPSDLLKQMRG